MRQLVEQGHDSVVVKAAVEAAVNERLERAQERRSHPEGSSRKLDLDIPRHVLCVFAGCVAYFVGVVIFNLGPALLDPSPGALICFVVGIFLAESAFRFLRGS